MIFGDWQSSERANTKIETYADGTVLINGRRCTCNDRRSWTRCRCFVWLIPLLAVLTLSWLLDYTGFGIEQAALLTGTLVLLSIIYIYLCFFKYLG